MPGRIEPGEDQQVVRRAFSRTSSPNQVPNVTVSSSYFALKLQEEERERRLDFVPEVSALEQDPIQIDPDTRDMLESLGYGSLTGVSVNQARD